MLVALGVWVPLLIAAWGFGDLFRAPLTSQESFAAERVALQIYLGLLLIAFALLAVALVSNVTVASGVLVAASGIVLAIRRRPSTLRCPARVANWIPVSGSVAVVISLAMLASSREITFYDTALYHQQAVKWMSDFGLVPGLALLHVRFGWISSWFAGAAALNHGFLEGREIPIMGGAALAIPLGTCAFAICAAGVRGQSVRMPTLTWILFSSMVAAVALVWDVQTSLSTDLIIWPLPLLVAVALAERDDGPAARALGQALVLSALACTVRLTALPLLVVSGVASARFLVRHRSDRTFLTRCILISGGIILVFVAANFRVSGCPAFPSAIFCLSGSGSVGASVAADVSRDIYEFAAQGQRQTTALLLLMLGASLVLLAVDRRSRFVRCGLIVSWFGTAFVFFSAPNPRFAMGYLLLPVAAAAAAIWIWIAGRYPALGNGVVRLASVVVFLLAISIAGVSNRSMRGAEGWLYPPRMAGADGDPIHIVNRRMDLRTRLSLSEQEVGDIVVIHPVSSDQCWDAPLPCSPQTVTPDLELRDPAGGFGRGFRTSKAYALPVH